MMGLLWTVFATIILLLYYLYQKKMSFFQDRDIPEFKSYPFVGIIGSCMFGHTTPVDLQRQIYKTFKGRRIGGFFSLFNPVYVIMDPALIHQIAVTDFDYFTDRNEMNLIADGDPVLEKNLIALKGQDWRNMRAKLSPAFTSSKMEMMFEVIMDLSKKLMKFIEEQCEKENGSEPVTMEMKDLCSCYANDVIATAVFGIETDSLNSPNNAFQKAVKNLSNFNWRKFLIMIGYILVPKIMKKMKLSLTQPGLTNFFHNLLHSTISTRERERITKPDMIQLLMEAGIGNLKEGAECMNINTKGRKLDLDNYEVTAQALLFFLAGFETVSHVMSFTSYLLATHEDEQRKVQNEIDTILEDGDFTFQKLQNMKYLDMVLAESLRMYPPVLATDRVCTKHYYLAREQYEAEVVFLLDQVLWFPIYGIHHDSDYYTDPFTFIPERFNEENRMKLKEGTYLPFGIGPRNCIGMQFAQTEIKAMLADLLRHFTLKVVSKTQVPLKFAKQVSVAAENGIWIGFEPRKL